MTTLWLIRHGETDWNIDRRFQGSSDQPLNAAGRRQAASLAERLSGKSFSAIYASDLGRVQETAALALGGDLSQVQVDIRLREMDFGAWEGLTFDEIRANFPEEFERWWHDRDQNVHGGERISDAALRVEEFFASLRARHLSDEHILLFAHGGTLAILLALALGTDARKWWQFRLTNCSINELVLYPHGSVLTRLNDDQHLPQTSS